TRPFPIKRGPHPIKGPNPDAGSLYHSSGEAFVTREALSFEGRGELSPAPRWRLFLTLLHERFWRNGSAVQNSTNPKSLVGACEDVRRGSSNRTKGLEHAAKDGRPTDSGAESGDFFARLGCSRGRCDPPP